MQLFVRTDAGRTLVVAADADTLIRDVLVRVLEKDHEQRMRRTTALSSNDGDDDTDDDADDDMDAYSEADSDHAGKPNSGKVAASVLRCTNASSRYLHYGGVPLRPQRALCDYGIQPLATLELAARVRGGCFSFSITLWIIIFICCLVSICTCGLSLGVAACLLPFALLLPLCCL